MAPQWGSVKLNIKRGAGVTEFARFLTDLENAYLALHFLQVGDYERRIRRYRFLPPELWKIDSFAFTNHDWRYVNAAEGYPKDQLEISRISI